MEVILGAGEPGVVVACFCGERAKAEAGGHSRKGGDPWSSGTWASVVTRNQLLGAVPSSKRPGWDAPHIPYRP